MRLRCRLPRSSKLLETKLAACLSGHMGAHYLYMIWLWRRARAGAVDEPGCCGFKPSESAIRLRSRAVWEREVRQALLCCPQRVAGSQPVWCACGL